ncbi:MAG: outer membrane protein assembly factor BamA [Bacteroidota bacterium]
MKKLLILFFLGWLAFPLAVVAQRPQTPPQQPQSKTYVVAGIEVEGAQYSDKTTVISQSGLVEGETINIPGYQISDVIKRLWKENIFSDIKVRADNIVGDKVFLVIEVVERPRISQFSFQGISKSQADDLREKINFIRGTILTEAKQQSAKRVIRNFYVEKGFYNISVDIEEEPDKILKNGVVVNIKVNKGARVRVDKIVISGNQEFTDKRIIRKMKKFHQKTWWRVWARAKYVPKVFGEAKDALIQAYNDEGLRDATVESDTVYRVDDKFVRVEMRVDEGIKYFHRNIDWSGNFKYNSEFLTAALGIKSGDTYSQSKIQQRLFGDPNGSDLSSLYLDDGYLFFNLEPVEVLVEGDSIDLEMRMVEGPQATIRKVQLSGNTKTSDYVVRREIRTAPGNKFSRSDIIRSQREILALNYFDQEKLVPTPTPDQASGTVDIKYSLEERASDQLQLQGGWGGRIRDPRTGDVLYGGFVGTVQLAFNNFSSRRMFDAKQWRPVPTGDGQRLSIAFQANGQSYKNFSLTFQEPWLGGKKPNSLGVSASYLIFQSLGGSSTFSSNSIFNASVDYGQRLKFPDDFFTSRTSLGYKFYDIVNPSARGFRGFPGEPEAFVNIISLRQSIDRSSVDAPIYPRSGSIMSLSVEATPPYSLFHAPGTNYSDMSGQEKYRWLEYHKWNFSSNWFFRIVDNLVLSTKIEASYLGSYNKALGLSPFERYFLGGSGLVGGGFANLDGRQYIPLRGYENNSLVNNNEGYPIYNRFVMELRYPISLNQSAPVWVLGFLEGGNGYATFRDYNPFKLRRAAGGGVRVMLPMVGLLGLDWAYGFDSPSEVNNDIGVSGSQFHFILGQQF